MKRGAVRRGARIATLAAILAGTGWIAGLGGPAGAQDSAPTTTYGVDCGSDQVVTVITDSHIVPGQREGAAPNSRQALGHFLRQMKVRAAAADFARAGGGDGPGLHSHRRNGKRVATAYVEPIGDTYHVPNLVTCDNLIGDDR
jgi:hypothetical protein